MTLPPPTKACFESPACSAAQDATRSLLDRCIVRGERWIFSAGFNVASGMRDLSRIDAEVADIARLANAGARVSVLSHQGRHKDGSAQHLGDVATYLGGRLGREVLYVPENTTESAVDRSRALAPGGVALFGNTRHHPGEESNDPALAALFARLGDAVAVGGFSKAHREHASNTGLLKCLPGWAAHSLLVELERLSPWSGADRAVPSLAVLGGVKPEKTLVGLRSLSQTYDVVVPAGAVLNHVLRAQGHHVGESELGEEPERCTEASLKILGSATARTHVPSRVIIARRSGDSFADPREIRIAEGVPSGFAIVDFFLEGWLQDVMREFAGIGCRAVIAGTPSLFLQGFGHASTQLLDWASAPRVKAILLGGDTVSELPFAGPTSTGGGSALCYLGEADLPVLRALRENAAAPWTET
ncbi:phosphoglycerate kinase [Streptomyces sp. NBC_01013]|uniref:phosphoglycerate kinase n=1 Tax=Streptomyces sp. NBC_01013 TaxID=2903718 RepID=UPI00386C6F72|nr:phosphoglycerate kinase [Streptomyces sp. NBC_01013]